MIEFGSRLLLLAKEIKTGMARLWIFFPLHLLPGWGKSTCGGEKSKKRSHFSLFCPFSTALL